MMKPKVTKPLFDLKQDYDASLSEFIHQAGMLADAVSMLLSPEFSEHVKIPDAVADQLSERLAAFNRVRDGGDEVSP